MDNFPRYNSQRAPTPIGRWLELPEIIVPSNLRFIGEQIGPAEDRFKASMSRLFAGLPPLFRRAYLARVSYGEFPVSSVVLCQRFIESIEHKLQGASKHMFGEIHRTGDSYDTMLIGEDLEQDLRKVCKPFYESS